MAWEQTQPNPWKYGLLAGGCLGGSGSLGMLSPLTSLD